MHEVCLGDPASPWVLLIDDLLARDERGKVVETRARRVRPLNVHTGELREPFTFSMTGVFSTSRHCRAGVRSRTWFWTGEAGLQQREVATGKLTLASAQLRALVGDDASLAYGSATQGLIVTTQHNDKLLVDPDARTKRELPASAHGDDDPWISGHRNNLVPCAQRRPYPTFNCEGSRCRLAHSAIAGGTPGPPLPGAETLRVAAARCWTPDGDGVLATHLATLDESTRRLARLTPRSTRDRGTPAACAAARAPDPSARDRSLEPPTAVGQAALSYRRHCPGDASLHQVCRFEKLGNLYFPTTSTWR